MSSTYTATRCAATRPGSRRAPRRPSPAGRRRLRLADRTVSATAQTLPTGHRPHRRRARLGPRGRRHRQRQRRRRRHRHRHRSLASRPHVAGGRNCTTGARYNDGNGHGTHVAGTIGAKDDANGVVGVAPGARLWAVRVLNNNGSGSWSSVICGIDWVTANANTIEVANMSLGGTGSDTGCNDARLHRAICNSVAAGVTYAVAAGNESDDASKPRTRRLRRGDHRLGAGRLQRPARRRRCADLPRRPRRHVRRLLQLRRRRRPDRAPASASSRPGRAAATTRSAAPRWRRRT